MDVQPAHEILRDRGYTISGVARRYGIERQHLKHVLHGRVAPSVPVAIALTEATDLPVTELFDADALGRLR